MNIILIIAAILISVLFFINMKAVAHALCKILCGFFILFLLNWICGLLRLTPIGINLITATIAGTLGIPGSGLLLFIACFL